MQAIDHNERVEENTLFSANVCCYVHWTLTMTEKFCDSILKSRDGAARSIAASCEFQLYDTDLDVNYLEVIFFLSLDSFTKYLKSTLPPPSSLKHTYS